MADLRPLIGVSALSADPEADVLLVLSPDACMAARSFSLGYACVTLPRGATPAETDLAPLTGRHLLVWPDASSDGARIADDLASKIPDAVIILPPQGMNGGWNLATAVLDGWTADRVRTHIALERERIKTGLELLRRGQSPAPVPAEEFSDPFANPEYVPTEIDDGLDHVIPVDPTWPFSCLGRSRGEYYYLCHKTQQMVSLTPTGHTQYNFMDLAPLDWWEKKFPAKEGAAWKLAANALMQNSKNLPPFDSFKLRGRGCWADDGRIIFHAGDQIIDKKVGTPIHLFKTSYVYERGPTTKVDFSEPLGSVEAHRLQDLCDMLPWTLPIAGKFLAGWCVIAPICGALAWRPHIWITGPSGTGKSWTLVHVVIPLLGSFAHTFSTGTSEAAIRQTVNVDAIPVAFDEAETEDQRGQGIMKGILGLARASSTETGAITAKGSVSGEPIFFNVRSCFCFSAIGVGAVSKADSSRITSLNLEQRHDKSAFDALKSAARDTTGKPGWCASLRARTMSNISVILENCSTFSEVLVDKLGDQRAADQIGALLAGAYSLSSSKAIDLESAQAWVADQDWSGFLPDASDTDENLAFARLMEMSVRVEPEGKPGFSETAGNLVAKYFKYVTAPDQTEADKQPQRSEALLKHGIKIDADGISISNTHSAIARHFNDTPWAQKWKDRMGHLPGAKHLKGCRFGVVVNRAVWVPRSQFGSI